MKDVYTGMYSVTKKVEEVVDSTERVMVPVRHSLFKRFPVLAVLLVTFGVSATFFGTERLIGEIEWLNDRPFLILILGISALVLSGKLYQKLG